MQELFFPTLNFLTLVALLAYFAVPALKKSVKDRSVELEKLLNETTLAKQEAESKLRTLEDKFRTFESELALMKIQANEDAEAMRKKILLEAQSVAQRTILDSESQVAAQFAEFKSDLQQLVVTNAIDTAEKMIRERLSHDVQSKIIRDCMEKVS